MKIVKPLKLGLLKKTYTFLQKHYLVVSPLCFFNLRTGEILVEMSQWSVVQNCLGPTGILDMAMPKTKAEVLLAGSAFAPQAEGVQKMSVKLQVGEIDKELTIFGKRIWRRGLLPLQSISDPETFHKMPLHFGNSFGGVGYDQNPVGKGFLSRRQRLLGKSLQTELPNIEKPSQPFRKISQKLAPAGFAPVDITLPPRIGMAGTYDEDWQRDHFPGYAPDINWDIFNAAAEDQQQSEFWHGDEEYCLTGMHPSLPSISGQLPGIRARTFVRNKQREFVELVAKLDTLWFFPEVELGVMIFRGQQEIADSDGLDVAEILLAYENLEDPPRSEEYYQEILALRTAKKTALAHVFNESQLSPLKNKKQIQREEEELVRAKQKLGDQQQQIIAELEKKYGTGVGETPESPLKLPELPVFTPESIARNDIDLSEFLDVVDQQCELVKQYGEHELNNVRTIVQEELPALAANTANPTIDQALVGRPTAAEVEVQLQEVKQSFFKQQPIFELLEDDALADQDMSSLDKEALLKLRRFSPEATEPKQLIYPPVKKAMRGIVEEQLSRGESLVRRDMAGLDLCNFDFSSRDLQGALFERANLSGANFNGCNLRDAVFTDALLDGATFVGCELSGANLSKTRGLDVDFSHSTFQETWFMDSYLTACQFKSCRFNAVVAQKMSARFSDFSDSELLRSNFVKTDFYRACFASASVRESMFLEADLSLCDFSSAALFRCALMKVQANLANFTSAMIERVQTGGDAQLVGVRFQQADIKESGFRQVNLKGADFSKARLAQCDLGGSDLSYCNFYEAKFTQSVLSDSDLNHCNCLDASFYQSKGRKVRAKDTTFESSECLFMDWQQASWIDCQFDNIKNLNNTCLEISP